MDDHLGQGGTLGGGADSIILSANRREVNHKSLGMLELWNCILKKQKQNELLSLLDEILNRLHNEGLKEEIPSPVLFKIVKGLSRRFNFQIKLKLTEILTYLVESCDSRGDLLRLNVLPSLICLVTENLNNEPRKGSEFSQCEELNLVHNLLGKIGFLFAKLSQGPKYHQVNFLEHDMISYATNLCSISKCLAFNFADDKARNCLLKLTENKNLIGNVSDEKLKALRFSNPKCHGTSELTLPLILYDTSDSVNDLVVHEVLLGENYVWPLENTAKETKTPSIDNEWIDVFVTHVVDGIHFYGWIGGEKSFIRMEELTNGLKSYLQLSDISTINVPPHVGDEAIAVGNDQSFFRVEILSQLNEANNEVEVFAVDYGFTTSVKYSCLYSSPLDFSKDFIKPEAVLCKLKEVCPPPMNKDFILSLLETLFHLTSEKNRAGEDFSQDSTLSMLKFLVLCPDLDLKRAALKVLSEVSNDDMIKMKLAGSGMMPILLDTCTCPVYCNQMDVELYKDIILFSLKTLVNMLDKCDDNKAQFKELGGGPKVHSFCSEFIPLKVRTNASLILKYIGFKTSSNAPESNRRNVRARGRSQRDMSQIAKPGAKYGCLRKSRLNYNDHSDEETDRLGLTRKQCVTSGDDTDGETIISKQSILEENSSSPVTSSTSHFAPKKGVEYSTQGTQVGFKQDECHEIRHRTKQITSVGQATVSSLCCGFLNSGIGGSIYFGILKEGSIVGINITRKERDSFRKGVDDTMRRITPVVGHSMYEVIFTQVAIEKKNKLEPLQDQYVIEMRISPNTERTKVFVPKDGNLYFREGGDTMKYIMQDLHERKVEDFEIPKLKEKRSLEHEIYRIKREKNLL